MMAWVTTCRYWTNDHSQYEAASFGRQKSGAYVPHVVRAGAGKGGGGLWALNSNQCYFHYITVIIVTCKSFIYTSADQLACHLGNNSDCSARYTAKLAGCLLLSGTWL